MSTTAQDIFYDVRALLDEYTDDGTVTPDDEVADLMMKSIRFINMAQKELYKTGKVFKKFEVTNKPHENLLGSEDNFSMKEYTGTAQHYPDEEGVSGATAYYFEADGQATVKIQEFESGVWSDLVVVSVPGTVTSMTPYKGTITPTTAGNPTRMVFDGPYYYLHKNRALFSKPFNPSRLPDYRPWIKITMPSDFRSVDAIVNEFPVRKYTKDANYKWEGFKDLYIDYFYEGTIRVIYKPVPANITAMTDTLEVDDITARSIAYYVAAKLAPFENTDLVTFYEGKFTELKAEAMQDMPAGEDTVTNQYVEILSGVV